MKALIAAAALALATSASAHDLGQAKYLGNEGILVAKGGAWCSRNSNGGG